MTTVQIPFAEGDQTEYAPSFTEGDSIYISDNGFVAKGFRKGSPDYPYASLI